MQSLAELQILNQGGKSSLRTASFIISLFKDIAVSYAFIFHEHSGVPLIFTKCHREHKFAWVQKYFFPRHIYTFYFLVIRDYYSNNLNNLKFRNMSKPTNGRKWQPFEENVEEWVWECMRLLSCISCCYLLNLHVALRRKVHIVHASWRSKFVIKTDYCFQFKHYPVDTWYFNIMCMPAR